MALRFRSEARAGKAGQLVFSFLLAAVVANVLPTMPVLLAILLLLSPIFYLANTLDRGKDKFARVSACVGFIMSVAMYFVYSRRWQPSLEQHTVPDVGFSEYYAFFLFAGLLCAVLAAQMAHHYFSWMVENPRLTEENATRLRSIWKLRNTFRGLFVAKKRLAPNSGVSEQREMEEPPAIRSYWLGLLPIAAAYLLGLPIFSAFSAAGGPAATRNAAALTLSAMLLLALGGALLWAKGSKVGLRSALRTHLLVLESWLAEPNSKNLHIFRSPAGASLSRFYTLFLLLASLALPVHILLLPSLHGGGGEATLLARALVALVPIGSIYAISLALTARSLAPLHAAVEEGGGNLIASHLTYWDGVVQRLQSSTHPAQEGRIWLGFQEATREPVLIHRDDLIEHVYMFGGTGSGKTSLGVMPLLAQVVRMAALERAKGEPPFAVVVLDLKGDQALFETARLEAERAGMKFKWFSTEVGRSSYLFNPLAQGANEYVSFYQLAQTTLDALGLDHGEAYGANFYSGEARVWLTRTLQHFPAVKSLAELRDIAERGDNFSNEKEKRDAKELLSELEILSAIEPLNISPLNSAYPTSVREGAMRMDQALERGEVLYFSLGPVIEPKTVRSVARLALFALHQACYQRQRRSGAQGLQAVLFIDEFQNVVSRGFRTILQQGRVHGLSVVMSNQNISDLRHDDVDLMEVVLENTRIKRCFAVKGLAAKRLIMDQKVWALASESRRETNDGTEVQKTLAWVPKFSDADVERFSSDPTLSWLQVETTTCILKSEYSIAYEDFVERQRSSWPAANAETIVVPRFWDHETQAIRKKGGGEVPVRGGAAGFRPRLLGEGSTTGPAAGAAEASPAVTASPNAGSPPSAPAAPSRLPRKAVASPSSSAQRTFLGTLLWGLYRLVCILLYLFIHLLRGLTGGKGD